MRPSSLRCSGRPSRVPQHPARELPGKATGHPSGPAAPTARAEGRASASGDRSCPSPARTAGSRVAASAPAAAPWSSGAPPVRARGLGRRAARPCTCRATCSRRPRGRASRASSPRWRAWRDLPSGDPSGSPRKRVSLWPRCRPGTQLQGNGRAWSSPVSPRVRGCSCRCS